MISEPIGGPLRGSIDIKQCMEKLQDGLFRAVTAAARCSIMKPDPDDGMDWQVDHRSDKHMYDDNVHLRVQLKSTYQVTPVGLGDSFPLTLENDHLLTLSRSPVTIPRILVVMILPRDIWEWVESSPTFLSLRHCAYWVNLEGKEVSGRSKTTVRVPTTQVFDDQSLCEMLERIGKGGKP